RERIAGIRVLRPAGNQNSVLLRLSRKPPHSGSRPTDDQRFARFVEDSILKIGNARDGIAEVEVTGSIGGAVPDHDGPPGARGGFSPGESEAVVTAARLGESASLSARDHSAECFDHCGVAGKDVVASDPDSAPGVVESVKNFGRSGRPLQ